MIYISNNKAWDALFNHGIISEETIYTDIMTGLLQPRNTIFFNRNFGAGIHEFENRSGISKEIALRFNICKFFAERNLDISEKIQAITSNQAIDIQKKNGEMDITVNYYRPDLTKGVVQL